MKFLVENHHGDSRLEMLVENTATGKQIFLEGPMVMCDKPNRNGRNYDLETVGRPSVEAYNRDYVEDGRAIGEVEHPEYPFPKLSEAATIIKSPLIWQGTNAIGKALVLNNPKGQIIRSLAEAGYNLGVSTRGLGDTRKVGGIDQVKPGYMITAVDTVDRPSGQTCYVKALTESVDWVQTEAGWIAVGVNGKKVDEFIKLNEDEDEMIRRFKIVLDRLS